MDRQVSRIVKRLSAEVRARKQPCLSAVFENRHDAICFSNSIADMADKREIQR